MRTHAISQQKLEKKPLDISLLNEKLPRSVILTFHKILCLNKAFKSLYFSQYFLGSQLKKAQQTISDHIALLDEHNLVVKFDRGRGKTIEYEVNPYLLQEPQLDKLKVFFNNFFAFSLIFLSSISAGSRVPVQFNLQGFNLSYRTGTIPPSSTRSNEESLLYYHDPTWYYQDRTCTSCTEWVPNEQKTMEEFEAILNEGRQYMKSFTEEQLTLLAQYPKASLEYAQKMLTKDMAAGKAITNLFAYFHSIARKHSENSIKGKSEAYPVSAQAKTVPLLEVMAQKQRQEERYQQFLNRREQQRYDTLVQLGYDPDTMSHAAKVDVLNRYRMSYYTKEDCTNKT